MFEPARERGAVIATLFRTSPAPYRRLGCEEVGVLIGRRCRLRRSRRSHCEGLRLRAAQAADVSVVLDIYRAIACASNGLMERSGPLLMHGFALLYPARRACAATPGRAHGRWRERGRRVPGGREQRPSSDPPRRLLTPSPVMGCLSTKWGFDARVGRSRHEYGYLPRRFR